MGVEIVRELRGFRGAACLVQKGARYFVVSSVVAYSGPETLVFPADDRGEITDWMEVAGGRLVSREEAIDDLAEQAYDDQGRLPSEVPWEELFPEEEER